MHFEDKKSLLGCETFLGFFAVAVAENSVDLGQGLRCWVFGAPNKSG